MPNPSEPPRPGELPETLLAKNLVAARVAMDWTQEALSAASGISRATIAQLETGVSDPRLSTIAALAKAFRLPLPLLLIAEMEVRAIAALLEQKTTTPVPLSPADGRQLQRLVTSGMLRDRSDAVRLAAQRVAETPDAQPLAILIAGIFAGFVPTPGIDTGAALGTALEWELERSGHR